VDFGLVSSARWDELRNRYGGEYFTGPALITQYLAFDVTRLPFGDRRVRRAFAMAIDREELAGVALRGYGSPATGGFVPPGMPGHSPGIGLRYDPESARRLLAEAGYPGGRGFPALEPMPVLGDELRAIVANLRQQILVNLGVEISWRSASRAEAFRILGRRVPQMYVSGWEADYPDPASFLWDAGWWSGSGWHHEEYGETVERARQTTSQRERIRLYQAADRILVEECPIIPLDHLRRHVLVKPWVARSQPTGPGSWRSWRDIIIEPHA
jgi:ABC-type transport system substrate-binding protein